MRVFWRPLMLLFGVIAILCASAVNACESMVLAELKDRVEGAFETMDWDELDEIVDHDAEFIVKTDIEMADNLPTQTQVFPSMAAFVEHFSLKYKEVTHRLVPTDSVCGNEGCQYTLPMNTLHHGVYLLGFEVDISNTCARVISMSVHEG